MADVCDQADVTTEFLVQAQINSIRNQGPRIAPHGECHNCEEPFPAGSKKLFCDSECASDWEQIQQR